MRRSIKLYTTMRFIFLAVAIGVAVVGSVSADENVREVEEKLRDGGFYSGNIDGAYSSQLSAALTRYQIRNGLSITGQLDVDTSKELSAKPAVTNNTGGFQQTSRYGRRLRKRSGDHQRAHGGPRAPQTPPRPHQRAPRKRRKPSQKHRRGQRPRIPHQPG